MKRLFLRSRQLPLQLSLSYIIVVLVTIPTLLVVGLAAIVLTSLPSPSGVSPSAQLIQLLETNGATQVVTKEITQHLSLKQGVSLSPFLNNLNADHLLGAAVIGGDGQLLALYGPKGSSPALGSGSFMNVLLSSQQAQGIIRSAFANDQRPADLTSTFADGRTIAAVPLPDPMHHNRPPGVLFVVVSGLKNSESTTSNPLLHFFSQFTRQHNAVASVTGILPYALIFILVISIIGTLFGVVTARRITKRLQRITSAVHAWSQGKFLVEVNDPSPDELGQLAQNLNQMAQQVQMLLDTQRSLALLEERQRVARDLHDSVKQQTFALTLLIGAAQSRLPSDPTSAQRSLSRAEVLANQIRQELTTILQQLRPVALANQRLQEALRTYTHQWSQQTGITVEFHASGIQALRSEIEEALFRVAQEALANVARHSQATQVRVHLDQAIDQVCLSVDDNGKGFELARDADTGQGLANMHERVEAFHGNMSISSTPDGTLLNAYIPFPTVQLVHVKHVLAEDNSQVYYE